MALPTDGNEPSEHPDLAGVAGEMRAAWRAEQEDAAADAAAQWRHGRGLSDWLRDRMHAGDRVAVTVAAQLFAGLVDEVGDDLVAVRGSFGRVEIHVTPGIPISIALAEHATHGGARSASARLFRDALVARDAQVDVRVGTLHAPDGLDGTLLVGRDFVTVVDRRGTETVVPISQIAWVSVSRP